MALQFRKGTAAERLAATTVPAEGEPWFTVDDGQLYVGDGITPGGVNVGSNVSLNSLTNVETIQEQTASIATYTINSNAAIITTTSSHSYYTGLVVTISGSPVATLNGTHTLTSATPGTSVFVFTLVAANVAVTSTSGTVAPQIPDGSALVWNQADGEWQDGLPLMSANDLIDIDTTTNLPVAGNYLTWDDATDNWVPGTVNLGIGDLSDVDTTTVSPVDGDLLIYNDTDAVFEPGILSINALNDVDTVTTAPGNGDVLAWNAISNVWAPAAAGGGSGTAILSTSFRYRLATAPTSVVASSDMLGKNLGQILELTFANKATLGEGPPSAAFNPSLTGVTFNSTLGQFNNIPQGVYLVNVTATININNVVPSFVTTPPMVYFEVIGFSTGSPCFFETSNYLTPVLPYASYGSALSSLVYSGSFTWTAVDTNPLTNLLEIYLDQDQGPTYYVERASIDLTRIADA